MNTCSQPFLVLFGKGNFAIIKIFMKIKHILLAFALTANIQNTMAQNKIKQTAGKDQLGGFEDKFA